MLPDERPFYPSRLSTAMRLPLSDLAAYEGLAEYDQAMAAENADAALRPRPRHPTRWIADRIDAEPQDVLPIVRGFVGCCRFVRVAVWIA